MLPRLLVPQSQSVLVALAPHLVLVYIRAAMEAIGRPEAWTDQTSMIIGAALAEAIAITRSLSPSHRDRSLAFRIWPRR